MKVCTFNPPKQNLVSEWTKDYQSKLNYWHISRSTLQHKKGEPQHAIYVDDTCSMSYQAFRSREQVIKTYTQPYILNNFVRILGIDVVFYRFHTWLCEVLWWNLYQIRKFGLRNTLVELHVIWRRDDILPKWTFCKKCGFKLGVLITTGSNGGSYHDKY